MTRLFFFLPCIPGTRTAQQKRVSMRGGKPVFFHDAQAEADKQTYAALMIKHRPKEPMNGPLKLTVMFYSPFPKKMFQTKEQRSKSLSCVPKLTRPDCSNIIKQIEDLLVILRFIEDDALVYDLRVQKFFDLTPGIAVEIESEE